MIGIIEIPLKFIYHAVRSFWNVGLFIFLKLSFLELGHFGNTLHNFIPNRAPTKPILPTFASDNVFLTCLRRIFVNFHPSLHMMTFFCLVFWDIGFGKLNFGILSVWGTKLWDFGFGILVYIYTICHTLWNETIFYFNFYLLFNPGGLLRTLINFSDTYWQS